MKYGFIGAVALLTCLLGCAKPVGTTDGDPPCSEDPECWKDELRDEFSGYAAFASGHVNDSIECRVAFSPDSGRDDLDAAAHLLELQTARESQLLSEGGLRIVASQNVDLQAIRSEHMLGLFRHADSAIDRVVMTCPDEVIASEDMLLLVPLEPRPADDLYRRSHGAEAYTVAWDEALDFVIGITDADVEAPTLSASYWQDPVRDVVEEPAGGE